MSTPTGVGQATPDDDKDAPTGARCAWCEINARAVPDEPPIFWEGKWYHRRGCYSMARLVTNGYLPAGTRRLAS